MKRVFVNALKQTTIIEIERSVHASTDNAGASVETMVEGQERTNEKMEDHSYSRFEMKESNEYHIWNTDEDRSNISMPLRYSTCNVQVDHLTRILNCV